MEASLFLERTKDGLACPGHNNRRRAEGRNKTSFPKASTVKSFGIRKMHVKFATLKVALLVSLVQLLIGKLVTAQQQDPITINGGSLLAMSGKQCVAVAVDKRFGSGPQMVNIAPRHVWVPQPNLMIAFVGLDGDVQSLAQTLQVEMATKLNRALGFDLLPKEDSNDVSRLRRLSPQALASLTSHILYRNRGKLYVLPLVLGLNEKTGAPFLCGMDSIGAQSLSSSFVCAGAAATSLYGTAEAFWKPDMEGDELAEACGKAFQSALERDCYSGYGSTLYLITKDGVIEYELASRND